MNHRDWVRFLDSEIVDVLPDEDRSILMALSRRKDPCLGKICLNQ